MAVQRAEGAGVGKVAFEAEPSASDGLALPDVLGILSRRRFTIVGITAAFCALAVLYLAAVKPTFTATAQVYVDPRDRPTPKDDPGIQYSVPGDGLLLVESQLKIITSNDVLSRVVDEMKLDADPDFNGQGGLLAGLKAALGLKPTEPPALTALRKLRDNTVVKRNDRSFVIDIGVAADTADRSAEITNALANAYLEEQADANAEFNRRLAQGITAQLDGMRNAVTQSEQAVAAYKAEHNLVGTRTRLVTEAELDDVNTQLTAAKAKLSEAQSRVDLVRSSGDGGAQLDALPEAIQSGTIVQLRSRAADISREEAQLALVNGPNHPALQVARAQLRDIQAAIRREVRLIAQAVLNTETAAATNVQTLQARFDQLKDLSKQNDAVLVPLHELERKADSDRAVYESFLAKAKTASEQQAVDTTNIRLISRALPPNRKSWPPSIIILAAALFGGLTVGIATALARDSLGRRRAGTVAAPAGRRLDRQPPGLPPMPALPQ